MDNKKIIFPSLGRLRQRDYVLCQLFLLVLCIVGAVLYLFVRFFLPPWLVVPGVPIALIVVEIYLTAKRLHDCNISGWFSLLFIYPPFAVLGILFMCLYPGTKGVNKFGADPNENDSASNKSNRDVPKDSH